MTRVGLRTTFAWAFRLIVAVAALALIAAFGRYLPSDDVVLLLSILAASGLAVRMGSLGIGTALTASLAKGARDISEPARVWCGRIVLATGGAFVVGVGGGLDFLVSAMLLAVAWTSRDHLFSVIRAEHDVYVELVAGPLIRLAEITAAISAMLLGVRSAMAIVATMALVNLATILTIAAHFRLLAAFKPSVPKPSAISALAGVGIPLFISGAPVSVMQLTLERAYVSTISDEAALFLAGGLRGLDTFMSVGATLILLRPYIRASRTTMRETLTWGHAVLFSVGGSVAFAVGALAAVHALGLPDWSSATRLALPLLFIPVWLHQAFQLHQEVALRSAVSVIWARATLVSAGWISLWLVSLEMMN